MKTDEILQVQSVADVATPFPADCPEPAQAPSASRLQPEAEAEHPTPPPVPPELISAPRADTEAEAEPEPEPREESKPETPPEPPAEPGIPAAEVARLVDEAYRRGRNESIAELMARPGLLQPAAGAPQARLPSPADGFLSNRRPSIWDL